MDKKFVMSIAAMAALTLVSCSSDDLDSLSDNSSKNEAISFDGYLGRSAVAVNGTRGSEVKIDDLQSEQSKGFGVFGYYNNSDPAHKPDTEQTFDANLFNNQQVTYKNSKWTYSPLKFWPVQGHIDFLAYAPYDAGTFENTYQLNFKVSETIAKQIDLLYAKADGKTKDNISTDNNKVKFHFNHALSRLGYTAKLSGDYSSNATFTLDKITLAGSADEKKNAFYTSGTIDLSKEKNAQDFWKGSDDKRNYTWSPAKSVTVKPEDTKCSNPNYLFVIPQDFSKTEEGADKLYVIVTYTIKYTGVTESITNTVYKQIIKKFEPGTAYVINLTLGLPIEFDATVTEWGNDNSIDCTEPWDR